MELLDEYYRLHQEFQAYHLQTEMVEENFSKAITELSQKELLCERL